MSANTNFQSNITFKGKFDVSEILASIKQMRQQISQTSNIELLGDLDKQINKVEDLGKTIQAQIGKGFSSQREFSSFQSNINKLELEFEKLGNNFDDINVDNLKKSLKAAEKDIKDLENKAKKAAQIFASSFKASSNNITGAESIKKEIIEAAKQGKSLEETQTRIKEIYDNQTRALIEQNKELKQQRETVTKNLTNTQGLFANVGLRATSFKNSNGSAISATQFTQVRAEFEKIASESTNAQDAVNKFNEALAQNNIEFKNASTIQGKFSQAISNYQRTVAPIEAELNELNKQIGDNEHQISKFTAQQEQLSTTLNNEAEKYRNAATSANAYTAAENTLTQTQRRLRDSSAQTSNIISILRNSMNGAVTSLKEGAAATEDSVNSQEKMNSTLDQLKSRIGYLLSFGNAYYQLRNIIRQTFTDVQKLDKAFASIAMVTDKTVQDLWSTYGDYSEMANRLGQSTESAIKASALFYQQGLDTAEALRLTEDTMKLATLAGADFETATQQMTAALRGFHMEMDQGATVTDVYSELAANAAADVNGIAYAMSKTASIAANAGMDFETTAAFLTNMIETTQEAPENIGTAMKTIIARFTELKDNVSEADSEFDDLDYNKVDKALKSVGISLKDSQGQFRDLDDVFLELSSKWDTLDRNTQRYIATIAAGSRQQSRFIAMMEDYDRTMELVETAQDSAGRSEEQFAKYQDTVEYKINQLKNSWEQFRTSLIDSDAFKGAIDSLTGFVQSIQNIDFKKLIVMTPIVVPLVQSFFRSFIQGVQNSAQNFNKVGEIIGKGVSGSFDRISFNLTRKLTNIDLEPLAQKVRQSTNKIEELSDIKVKIDVQKEQVEQELNEAKQALEQFRSNIPFENPDELGWDRLQSQEANLVQKVKQLTGELNQLNLEEEENAQASRIAGAEAERAAQNFSNAANKAGLSEDVLKQKSQQVSSALQMVGSAAVTCFSAIASGADAGDALKIAFTSIAMQAANLATQLMATAAKTAVEAYAGGASIGEALGKGLSAGFAATGTGLIIVAIAAAVAALGLVIYNLVKQYKEEHKSLEDQISEAEEKLKEIEKIRSEKESASKETQEQVKNTEDLISRYDELSRKLVKTTEEQEEWTQLIADINEQFPEIVSSYDEANGKISVQRDLWQDIVDLQKEAAQDAAQESLIATAASIGQKRRNESLEYAQKIQQSNDKYNWQNGDLNAIAKAFGYSNYDGLTESEQKELFYRYADQNDEGWKIIRAEISNISSEAKEAYDKQIAYYNELEKQNISSYLQAGGTEKGVADFIASGAQAYKTKNVDQFNLNTVATADEIYDSNGSMVRDALKVATAGISEAFFVPIKTMQTNDYQKWEELNSDQKKILKSMGYENAEAWEEARKNLADDTDFAEEYAEAAYTYNAEKIAQALDDNLGEAEKAFINDYMTNYTSMTEEEMAEAESIIQGYIDSIKDKDARDTAQKSLTDWEREFDNQKQEISQQVANFLDKDANDFTSWTIEQLQAYDALVQGAIDEMGTGAGKAYAKEINTLFENQNLTPSQINQALNSVSWDTANAMNWDDFRESAIENLKEIGVPGAEAFFDSWAEYEKRWGNLNISISNSDELDEYLKKIDETVQNISGARDDIVELNTKIAKGEELNLDDYDKYAKAIEDLGLTVSDYLTIDSNGNIVADAKALQTIYQDAYDQQIEDIKKQIAAIDDQKKAERQEIELIKDANILELKRLNIEQRITKQKLLQEQAQFSSWKSEKNVEERNQKYSYWADLQEQIDSIDISDVDKQIEAEEAAAKEKLAALDDWEVEERKQLVEKLKELEARKAADVKLYSANAAEALKKDTDDTTKAIEDAQKKVQDALEKIVKAEQDVIDKTNELNKALYGDSLHKNKLDPLYNYNTQLEQFTKNATRAKEALSKMQSGDNARSLINDFLTNTHGELVNRRSQNEVIAASIANYQANLTSRLSAELASMNARYGASMSTNTSDYIYQNGNRVGINFQALNAAQLPDSISDYVEETVETINKLQDQIDDNVDEIKKKEQELRDMRKDALERRKSLEDEVVKTLQEKAKEEIDTQKDKYDALKDADNDYLDALEDAIKRERDLRNKANEWDSLATKEKKLSLIQRDTSGANEKEVMQLENEIQNDREKLLDESIDDIIDGMKEMYELQQESREIEIEYQEAMLENADTIKAATAIIEGWHTSDDLVAWFVENATKEFTEGSETTKEIMITEWQETGDQMVADTELLQTDIMSATEVTQEQITTNIYNTSEILTSQSQLTLDTVLASTNDAIQKGQQALADAIASVQAARDEYTEAIAALKEAEDAVRQAQANADTLNSSIPAYDPTTSIHYMESSIISNLNRGQINADQAIEQLAELGLNYQKKTRTYYNYGAGRNETVVTGIEKAYASGGLVDYTGPAWVDGTPSQPEAFLSAEDTRRIGEAAQLLADLPVFGGSSFNSTSITNGDSLIEVHINIENIASDVDLDNALDKMKSAIWEAANPAGSSVILSK